MRMMVKMKVRGPAINLSIVQCDDVICAPLRRLHPTDMAVVKIRHSLQALRLSVSPRTCKQPACCLTLPLPVRNACAREELPVTKHLDQSFKVHQSRCSPSQQPRLLGSRRLATSADMAVQDPDDWQLYLMIDDGTSKATVGYQIIRKGKRPEPSNTSTLPLQGVSSPEVPQLVGLTPDRKVIWGHKLESLLLDQTLKPGKVHTFSHLKVLLFPSSDAEELETGILGQLKALPGAPLSMEDLQRMRLAKLHEDILEAVVKVAQQYNWSRAHVGALQTYTQVAVPEMAEVGQRKAFQTILRAAGFRNVSLVSEAEAAAVWRSWKCHEYFAKGNHLIPSAIQVRPKICTAPQSALTFLVHRKPMMSSFSMLVATLR